MQIRTLIALAIASLISTQAWADLRTGLSALERSDYATALKELTPLAENGNREAQFNLGKMYLYGWGVRKNEIEAATWYRKAAEQKDVRAQEMLNYLQCEKGIEAKTSVMKVEKRDIKSAVRIAHEGRTLCPKLAQKLEEGLKSNPDNLYTRIRLLGYYFVAGSKDIGVQNTIEARRRHILWLIQNQPDALVLILPEASLDPAGHALADPTGYAEGKRLWLEQAEKPSATASVYASGARYLQLHDKAQAEQLLLKGKAAYPNDKNWDSNLGYLYALAMLGVTGLNNTGIPVAASPEEASSPFATKARQTLEKSNDPILIGTTGAILSQYGMMLSAFGKSKTDESNTAEQLLTKANQLDPQNPLWAQTLAEHLIMQVKRTPGSAKNPELLKRALSMMESSLQQTSDTEWRMGRLGEISKIAFNAGEYQKAEKYAQELLKIAEPHPTDQNYGQALHDGNMILGRLDLKQNNIAKARIHLLKAGHTPGGGTLSSFGPNMSLAKDLLERGEKATVIEYLQLCKNFWSYPRNPIDTWLQAIQAGKIPDFGANLDY